MVSMTAGHASSANTASEATVAKTASISGLEGAFGPVKVVGRSIFSQNKSVIRDDDDYQEFKGLFH